VSANTKAIISIQSLYARLSTVSENNLQTTTETEVSKSETTPDQPEVEEFIVKINRETDEVTIKNPRTGKEIPVKAGPAEKRGPFTADEFRKAWEKLCALGVTWTTDIPPVPSFLDGYERDATFWKKYEELQKEYPTFPRELGSAILHGLLKPQPGTEMDEKVNIIRSALLTHKYRTEFFFKYAIKVPYFEDLDWEVVIKAHERGVTAMPKIAYALLSLTLRNPVDSTLTVEDASEEYREPEFITVAVNEELIDKLTVALAEARNALDKTQKLAESLTDLTQEEDSNVTSSTE
jgi:hypothetical protein